MAIKLKNNRKIRITIVVAILSLLAIGTVLLYPAVNQRAMGVFEKRQQEKENSTGSIESGYREEGKVEDGSVLAGMYQGCYVLYLEMMQQEKVQTAADVYLELADENDRENAYIKQYKDEVNMIMEDLEGNFEPYRSDIDYCIVYPDGAVYETNTSQPLSNVWSGIDGNELKKYYNDYFMLEFESNGRMNVTESYSANAGNDYIIKEMGLLERSTDIWDSKPQIYEESYGIKSQLKGPSDFTVIFGIPKTAANQIRVNTEQFTYGNGSDYIEMRNLCIEAGAGILYAGMLLVIAILVVFMTEKKWWSTEISMSRRGKWYVGELAVLGMFWTISMASDFYIEIWEKEYLYSYDRLWNAIVTRPLGTFFNLLFEKSVPLFLIFTVWYLSLRFIRPVFTLGWREYIRQYSFFYQIYPWIKNKWDVFREEVKAIDFSDKSMKTIAKIVVLNFVVIAICAGMWVLGIVFLVFYSGFLFSILKKQYNKVKGDYENLLCGVNRIAEGDLESEITEDVGVFEPIKGELSKIRTGFKKAVDEEVKSQRMKTELITNVSHDLKTPLTAITTYIELLKKEDITEDERRSYIETLEKKSLRLKVLIEDLFEVSKATSNNIILNPVEMDVVNLLKQVSIEHTEKYKELGLELRWNVPEGKVIRTLDTQKTYRIFENLFGNVQKYAMPGSRVYVDVCILNDNDSQNAEEAENGMHESCVTCRTNGRYNGPVQIVMKNMSAQELNVKAEEITERFVRGDSSRNTEGSGLGLAIAKSFTEAQGGKFTVEVDGDLFKVVIVF